MIYVGTCGYAYKDWLGTFYPGTARQRELLPYYAGCFRAVEIDSSFYGVLAPATVARMAAATPPEFRFCFKAPRTVTHVPEPARTRIHDDAAAFVESVAAIVNAGKFGCALLQFPNGFKPDDAARAYVLRAAAALTPLATVVEFRNRGWQTPQTHRMLAEAGLGWCNVDVPNYETLPAPASDTTSALGYVRFHGRNAATWWTGNNTTRYHYDYTPQELEPWAERVHEIDERTETTYAFFNNHARGNAPRNAEMFVELLRDRYGAAADEIRVPEHRPPAQGELFE